MTVDPVGHEPSPNQHARHRGSPNLIAITLLFLAAVIAFTFLALTSAPMWQVFFAGAVMFVTGFFSAPRAIKASLASYQDASPESFNATRMAFLGTLAGSGSLFITFVTFDLLLSGTEFAWDDRSTLRWLARQAVIAVFIAVPLFLLLRARLRSELLNRERQKLNSEHD